MFILSTYLNLCKTWIPIEFSLLERDAGGGSQSFPAPQSHTPGSPSRGNVNATYWVWYFISLNCQSGANHPQKLNKEDHQKVCFGNCRGVSVVFHQGIKRSYIQPMWRGSSGEMLDYGNKTNVFSSSFVSASLAHFSRFKAMQHCLCLWPSSKTDNENIANLWWHLKPISYPPLGAWFSWLANQHASISHKDTSRGFTGIF